MSPEPRESNGISLVSHHDLDGRPGFKLELQEFDGRWYLYSAGFWHSGYHVLDVTDPTEPVHLNWMEGPENTATIQACAADGLMVTSLEKPRAGKELVNAPNMDPSAPFEESAQIWDVEANPEEPELLGQFEAGGDGTHRNFYSGGDYAYLALAPPEGTGRQLSIVDISDPTDPVEEARWWWPGQGPDEEPGNESFYFHGPAYVQDDRAYLSYGSVGMVVLDVSDPTDPTYLTHADFGSLGSWLGCHSAIPIPDTDLVAVNDEAILEESPLEGGDSLNYVFLVDVSDEREPGWDGKTRTGPRIVSSIPAPVPGSSEPYDNYHEKPGRFGPHNQHHYREGSPRYKSNEYLFMTWFNAGLRIFDISDSLAPSEVAHYVPGDPDERIGQPRPESELVSTLEDVVVDTRGYIYCTDPQQGLFVFETDLI